MCPDDWPQPILMMSMRWDDPLYIQCLPSSFVTTRSIVSNYRDNLKSGAPAPWVALRPVASEPPCEILAVTADPSEGEAFTDVDSYIVEAALMPDDVAAAIAEPGLR
ncbi:DUF3305 domain-containing protein [Bradyrhizobium sp. 2TAF36]|uniref:DUF3305 domain-containing protein n=1 Tax=Bradyrhizobium sp. 2TAF36 TaxID=3233016 RepID=UPI003F8FD469